MSGIISSCSPGWVGKILGGYDSKAIDRGLHDMGFGDIMRGRFLHGMYLHALPGSIGNERYDEATIRKTVAPMITQAAEDQLITGLRTRQDALGELLVTLPFAAVLGLVTDSNLALAGAAVCLVNTSLVARDLLANGLPISLRRFPTLQRIADEVA